MKYNWKDAKTMFSEHVLLGLHNCFEELHMCCCLFTCYTKHDKKVWNTMCLAFEQYMFLALYPKWAKQQRMNVLDIPVTQKRDGEGLSLFEVWIHLLGGRSVKCLKSMFKICSIRLRHTVYIGELAVLVIFCELSSHFAFGFQICASMEPSFVPLRIKLTLKYNAFVLSCCTSTIFNDDIISESVNDYLVFHGKKNLVLKRVSKRWQNVDFCVNGSITLRAIFPSSAFVKK